MVVVAEVGRDPNKGRWPPEIAGEVAERHESGVPETVTSIGTGPPFHTLSTLTRATRSPFEVLMTVPTNTTAAASTCLAAPEGPEPG